MGQARNRARTREERVRMALERDEKFSQEKSASDFIDQLKTFDPDKRVLPSEFRLLTNIAEKETLPVDLPTINSWKIGNGDRITAQSIPSIS